MKSGLFTAAALLLSAPLQPAAAQEAGSDTGEQVEFRSVEEEEIAEFEREWDEAFAVFGEIFETEPLTEEQEARLPLAKQMSAIILPDGSFQAMMRDTMKPMMDNIMGMATSDPRTEVATLSGVPAEDLAELDDDAAQAALDILDPQFAARNDRMIDLITDMMGDLFSAMEPAYREAMARAFTKKFDEAETAELIAFMQTPLGERFARESFMVQYDPQMMGVMESMGPAMGEILPGMMEDFEKLAEEFPEARKFPDLGPDERAQISELLGKGEAELEALAPVVEEQPGDEEEPVA